MSDYRIVFNERSGEYRIERRSLLGWMFVMDERGRKYLTFADYDAARRHLCRNLDMRSESRRRWRVLDPCGCSHLSD